MCLSEKDEKRLIEFDGLSVFAKSLTLARADAMDEIHHEHQQICGAVNRSNLAFVGKISHVAVVQSTSAALAEHPFIAVVNIEKDCTMDPKWRSTQQYFKTPEEAFMHGVGFLAEGCNTRFAEYAWRMLKSE